MTVVSIDLTHDPIDPAPFWARIGDDACGAWNIFLGVTRNHHEGRGVAGLEYHCYEGMARSELQKLASAIADEYHLQHLYVVHRLGRVSIGETSLLVACSSHHRHQSLEGTHAFINRLKQDVPIWKREFFEDGGEGWVEGSEIVPSAPTS